MECLRFRIAIQFHHCTRSNKNGHPDFPSCFETDPKEQINLKIKDDILTKPIEMNIESTGIAPVEPVFFDITDQHETTDKEL